MQECCRVAAIGYMILQKDCSWLHLIERWSAGVLLLFLRWKGIDGIFECDYNNLRNIRRMEERGKIVSMIEDKIKYDIRSVVWDE